MTIKADGNGGFLLRYYDQKGRERQATCRNRQELDLVLLDDAGPRSADDLRTVMTDSVVFWYRQFPIARGCTGRSEKTAFESNVRWLAKPLANKPLSELCADDLGALLEYWEAGKLADSTETGLRTRLCRIIDAAQQRGIVHTNVARPYFELRKINTVRRMAVLPREEDIALLRQTTQEPFALFLLELVLETRPSTAELAALRYDDFDVEQSTVTYRFFVDLGEEAEQVRPYMIRTVPLSAALMEIFTRWRHRAGAPDSPYVFCKTDGTRQCENFAIYYIKRIQFLGGLPSTRRPGQDLKPDRVAKPCPFNLYLAPYSLQDLGNCAVVHWYRAKASRLQILTRMGRGSDRALERFTHHFADIDGHRGAFDTLDDLLDD